MGGAWERQIRTVRSVLNTVLDEHGKQLDDEALRTFMYETMAVVNSRPMSVDNLNDATSLEPLTPNHLLTTKSRVVLPPPGNFQKADVYSRKQWRRVQYLINEFWGRWRKEVLHHLQPRQKWTRTRRNLGVDDIVLVMDDNLPRNQWVLARVCKVYNDDDGHVRKVRVTVGDKYLDPKGRRTRQSSFLERPIQKLVLLLEHSDVP